MLKLIKRPVKQLTHPFFKGFPPQFKKLTLRNSFLAEVPAGQVVFRDGERADSFYLILKGHVNLMAQEQDVRLDLESRAGVLQVVGPGEVLGWSWAIYPYRWRFDAVAIGPVKMIAVNGSFLRKKMERNRLFCCEIYKRLVPIMNQRLIAARMKMLMFGGKPFQTAEGG